MLVSFGASMVMSNTATTAMVVAMLHPVLERRRGQPMALVLGAAFGANIGGMATIIGTPPNAIAFGTGLISTRDLLAAGALIGLIAPALIVLWAWLVLPWLL